MDFLHRIHSPYCILRLPYAIKNRGITAAVQVEVSSMWEWLIYTTLFLLAIIICYEWLQDHMFREGFTDGSQLPEFFSRYFPRRYDVVPGQTREGEGWIRNPRYFQGYVDVQRLGFKADFCRVVEKEDDPQSRMMACALAGQEGLDSMTYRTEAMRSGMRFSRDDYFNDANEDRRDDYCRIIKTGKAPSDAWEARCVPAGAIRFQEGVAKEMVDTNPPDDIADLLWFYEGLMMWYRFYDDILDYAENTQVKLAGGVAINESLTKTHTEGLPLNRGQEGEDTPTDQFLKVGENARLEFDSIVDLRQLRAISVWAYFDEFTNNARIFDFGNGAGKDNIFLGIVARGNRSDNAFGKVGARPGPDNLVCQAKAPEEVSPYVYMKTTDANVDEWTCPATEPVDSAFPPDEFESNIEEIPTTANLLFEIWDSSQRRMRILLPDAIPLKQWVHICLTTTGMEPTRPTWQLWINGFKKYETADGFLPIKSYTQRNYIGRSNWEGQTASLQDRDERFRGALFDFRLYRTPMPEGKIKKTHLWGENKLGLQKKRTYTPNI